MTARDMSAITPVRAKAFGPCAAPRALETKRAGLRLDGLDSAGAFEGYASLFDVVDLGGDAVAPGAFAASLRRTGAASFLSDEEKRAALGYGPLARKYSPDQPRDEQGRWTLTGAADANENGAA